MDVLHAFVEFANVWPVKAVLILYVATGLYLLWRLHRARGDAQTSQEDITEMRKLKAALDAKNAAEYFMICRVDGPTAGFTATEYPPFTIQSFSEKYPPGTYTIKQYKKGVLCSEMRETISSGPYGILSESQNHDMTIELGTAQAMDELSKLRAALKAAVRTELNESKLPSESKSRAPGTIQTRNGVYMLLARVPRRDTMEALKTDRQIHFFLSLFGKDRSRARFWGDLALVRERNLYWINAIRVYPLASIADWSPSAKVSLLSGHFEAYVKFPHKIMLFDLPMNQIFKDDPGGNETPWFLLEPAEAMIVEGARNFDLRLYLHGDREKNVELVVELDGYEYEPRPAY